MMIRLSAHPAAVLRMKGEKTMDFGMPYLLEMHSIEECCALARELGLKFVELNAGFPDCLVERLDPMELHRLSHQYGLYFTLHIEEECNPFTFNSTVRNAWLKSCRHALDIAAALQMPIVNMHFPRGDYVTLPDRRVCLYDCYAETFQAGLEQFRQMCEEALDGTSTRIAIENTGGWKAHEQRAIAYLLESPVFGLNLDIGHSHGIADADEPFFRQHDNRLIHMHGHDALGKKHHLALGDGEIDLAARFAWAERANARVVLETKTIAALRTSIERLPKFLA